VVDDRPDGANGAAVGGEGRKLVVCCIEGDGAPLQPALDVLGTRGIDSTVLDGREVRPAALTEHARRHGPDALYVLARLSEASPIGPATAVLRGAGIPAARISALVVDWRDPMALVEHVASLSSVPSPVLRTVVPTAKPDTRTMPPRTIASPPTTRETTGPRTVVPPPPRTASTRPKVLTVRVESPATPVAVPDAETTRLEPPIEPPIEPALALPVAPPMRLPPAPAEAPFAAPDLAESSPRVTSSLVLERAASGLRTSTAAMRSIAELTASRWRRAARWVTGSRARLLASAGVAVAASVVTIAVIAIDGDDARPTPASNVEVLASAAAPIAAAPTAAAPIAAIERVAAALPESSVPADPAEEAPLVDPSSPTVGAVRGVATFRGIVFAPRHAPKRRFRAAQTQCADMNTGAAQGWRMPTLGELHVLAVGRALPRGVYWSGTEADGFGKHALVWSEKKSAALPITKVWRGARSVCVRDATP
jgi:hypothetical protein